jgi:branched-chain amino acid transport system substrate-binding protein
MFKDGIRNCLSHIAGGTVRPVAVLAAVVASTFLTACEDPQPIKVGFIGSLTGRSADISEASRNAVEMLIQKINEEGGIDGSKIELLIRDNANDKVRAGEMVRDLHANGVVGIIGPNISSMAAGMIEAVNELKVLTISPTVSSVAFVGKDDYFFRINSSTRDNAISYARYINDKGIQTVAAAIDGNNRVFSESWLEEFSKEFTRIGGQVVTSEAFDATKQLSYSDTAERLVAARASVILMICNSVDTAQLSQQIRKIDKEVGLIASEWAASERLLVLGGTAIEGLELVQSYNRRDKSDRYLTFKSAYTNAFGRDPGYASVAAYDAMTALTKALEIQSASQDLRDALKAVGPFEGLQQTVEFDEYGDGKRTPYFVSVRNGEFTYVNE